MTKVKTLYVIIVGYFLFVLNSVIFRTCSGKGVNPESTGMDRSRYAICLAVLQGAINAV